MRLVLKLSVVFLFLNLIGCGGVITIPANPDTFAINSEELPRYTSGNNVALSNTYTAPAQVYIYKTESIEWNADMQQYTQSAITMLSKELEKQGVAASASSKKSVALKVYDVKSAPGWTIKATLHIEARLGNGDVVKVFAENTSPATAFRAVDGALMRAVTALMKNEKFVAYINK